MKHPPRKKIPKPTVPFVIKPDKEEKCPVCGNLIGDCICFEQDY